MARTFDEIRRATPSEVTTEQLLADQLREAIATAEEIRTAIGRADPTKGRHMAQVITKLEEALLWHHAKPSGIDPRGAILPTSNTIAG